MKKSYILLLIIGILSGCINRMEEDLRYSPDDGQESDKKVLLHFDVTIPDLAPSTKAIGDTPAGDIESIHFAVFGRSGYLKEYVEATFTPAVNNGRIGENTNRYTVMAPLTLAETSERHVHIIVNGPDSMDYGQETDIIPYLLSPEGKGAYWQYRVLPGIKAARDANDNLIGVDFVEIDGEMVSTGTGTFQISDETLAYFTDVPLIRNFAKIVVEDMEGCNFQTIAFAVINTPTQGSMAPYYSGGFIQGYENMSYQDLDSGLGYPALLPKDATFDTRIPTASDFASPSASNGVTVGGQSAFLYERPVPNEQDGCPATVVIVYGTFTDPDTDDGFDDSGNYYYKVDLMEDSQYYPIYRNFKYRVNIKSILRPGADSPEDAYHAMGSGDVSSDVSTQNLLDISDGTSRILVSEMNRILIHQYPLVEEDVTTELTLLYQFIPDVDADANHDGNPDPANDLVANGGPVSISLGPGDVITGFTVDSTDDANGWRKITLTTSSPTANARSQYIKIQGSNGSNPPLFRNVTFTMMNRQTLDVACNPKKVEKIKGSDMEIDITIPKRLQPSMFPIIFHIEAKALTLTPDNSVPNNNLPVAAGISMAGDGKQSFYYIRTLNESEYNELSAASSNQNYVTVPCYFKTNADISASTVYVSDEKGYFYPDSDSFRNYYLKNFTNLNLGNVAASEGANVSFSFSMDQDDDLPERVYFQLTNIRPTQTMGFSRVTDSSDPYYNWYWYSPTETTVVTLKDNYNPTIQFATTSNAGNAAITINADEYVPAQIGYPTLRGLTLNKNRATLVVGTPETLIATLNPANAPYTVSWSSSDNSVATVSANGVVTPLRSGTTTITASAGNYTATCTVTVHRAIVWRSASYTLSFTNNTNSSASSFTTSPQNVTFENFSQGGTGNNRYKQMGSRSGTIFNYRYSSGIVTVTAPEAYSDARIIGVTMTYNGGEDDNPVTYSGDGNALTGGSAASWGTTNTSSTSEVSGYNQLVITHACTSSSQYNDRNRLNGMTVYYGYFEYED